ncbi:MAG: hypothetical protein PVF70_01265 [Anaerolineales bacterium]|jgi:hypothetical protein
MQEGMLWLDSDQRKDLRVKIKRAAGYYHLKYGVPANVCFAHPSTLGKRPPGDVAGLKLRSSGLVLPDHFWLGVEDLGGNGPTGKLEATGQGRGVAEEMAQDVTAE